MAPLSFLQKNHKTLFYVLWTLMSLVQAGGTGLLDDEAYYWVYSRFPDWGYFDHPPMIAMLIRAGYFLFGNELGVRLMIVAMSTSAIVAIDSLIEKKNDRLFYAIILSMGLLQIGSIIAVPDVPLLFFIALFFIAYRKFCSAPGISTALLLGLITALMLYSKYHAVLVIFFSLLANLKLLKNIYTWIAGVIALVLFAPHLVWQYQHDFISVQYHLFERNATDYQLDFTTEYILGQILLAGPLIGWLLLWAAARYKPVSPVERAMRWTFGGVYLLFLISTFKGRSEANWTVPAFVSLIVLGHQYLYDKPKTSRWIYRLLIPSLCIVLAARVYMVLDIAPVKLIKKDEFHKNKEWAKAVKDRASGLPVVFVNSYQRASQYWFYSGDTSFSINNIFYRRNNYNFWPLEQRLQQKKILVVTADSNWLLKDPILSPRRTYYSHIAEPYFSFSQIRIYGDSKLKAPGHKLNTILEFVIPETTRSGASFHLSDSATISLVIYYHDNDPGLVIPTGLSLKSIKEGKNSVEIPIPDSVPKGKHRARWAIDNCLTGLPSVNSIAYTVEVE